jgi:hypothetical protein
MIGYGQLREDVMSWLEDVADRAPLAFVWSATAVIGFLIHFTRKGPR